MAVMLARHCYTCGRRAVAATGAYLALIARGRTLCSGCGRFQVSCTCERAA